MEAVPSQDGPPQQQAAAGQTTSQDTIPDSIKQIFFKDVSPPNLVADYDVLGFDADHCIVKYDIRKLSKLLYDITANDLFEHNGYPEEIKSVPDALAAVSVNNVIWDIQNKTLLKLGEGKIVMHAVKGHKKLTQGEIEEVYGSPPMFESLLYPATNKKFDAIEGAHWTLMTFFESCKAPVIAHGIELMERGIITHRTDLEFASDIMESIVRQYGNYDGEKCHPIAEFGQFFPKLLENPAEYIVFQPELRERLVELRQRGKKLFLGTNSHFEYMHVILKASLGEDWEQLFDLNLAYCRKPAFFRAVDAPMFCVDQSTQNMKGTAITNGAELVASDCYLEGNANIVHQFFHHQLGKEQIRVCYFGDHFWSDAHAGGTFVPQNFAVQQPKWDSIAIVEDLWWFDRELSEGKDPAIQDCSSFFGQSFFSETIANGELKKDFYISELEKVGRYAMPFLKNINRLMK